MKTQAIKIVTETIEFNPSSYVDPNARVFEWKGKVLRAISEDKADFFEQFLSSDLYHRMVDKRLMVPAKRTDYSLEGFAFVVEHPRIPFLSYCPEWPAVMLKDAAIQTLDICRELISSELLIQDASPWNILFDGVQPVFIDLGSIIDAPKDLLWTPYQQFCQFFLYPLYLSSAGQAEVARLFMFKYLDGISEETVIKLLPFNYKMSHPKIFSRVIFPYWLEKTFPEISKQLVKLNQKIIGKTDILYLRKRFFDALSAETEKLNIPILKSIWSNYYGEGFCRDLKPAAEWNQKQKVADQVLNELKPHSVLDIACNRGWFAMLAASKGGRVVAFDKDADCVSQLYLDAKRAGLNILPLVIDLLNPTPSFGWKASQFPPATQRLQCELVFAFAVIHHLIFKQYQSFDRVVETLKMFTKKYLLVEFPLPSDQRVREMWDDRCAWYNLENFQSAIKKHFNIIEVFDSFPDTRKLLLCEIIGR